MTSQLLALCFDANDPLVLARFWAGVLGWEMAEDPDGTALSPNDDTGFRIRFLQTEEQKTGKNRLHFDLAPPVDGDHRAEVERLVSLSATRADIGQGEVGWAVLADPDGNEFCVLYDGKPAPDAAELGVRG